MEFANISEFSIKNSSILIDNASQLIELSLIQSGDEADMSSKLETVKMEQRDPLYIILPITILYGVIFFSGIIGNISTCIVVAKNKSMHTATNYYLFSLAVSDLLLLVSGLPPEMYRLWWPQVYIFGDAFCMVQSFSAETSANATVLTITAFTVERYIAICHPFLTHTMSKLSRAVKFVLAIWLLALGLAVPQAIQYGMYYAIDEQGSSVSRCTITRLLVVHAFELSTIVFFAGPMTVITVLYILIAIKLRGSRSLTTANHGNETRGSYRRNRRSAAAQNRVVKMLVAVVVAFFVCWAPFHAQRLLAVYISHTYDAYHPPGSAIRITYTILDYVSGVLYFISTTVNPLLYNIMSNKFREAFKSTLAQLCHRGFEKDSMHVRTYSTLSRCQTSIRHQQQRVHEDTQAPVISTHLTERPRVIKSIPKSESTNSQHTSQLDSNFKQTTAPNSMNKSMFRDFTKTNVKGFGTFTDRFRIITVFRSESGGPQKYFVRHKSVDSANTISDSSLQDLDEIEFSNSDLVQYMATVNQDLS